MVLEWLLNYIFLSGFTWFLFLCWLVPFQIFYVKMTKEMFWKWLKLGTVMEMIFAGPIAFVVIEVGPQITGWVESLNLP